MWGEKGKNTNYVDNLISIKLKKSNQIVEVVPSTKHSGGCTLMSRTPMLVETKGIYNNPISIVEVVPSTKQLGDKVPDLDGRNPSQ